MFGRPAQLNSASTTAPILATASSICVGLAQVGLGEAREPGDVGLLDVDRVHLGAQLDEQLRRRRAHARRRAGDDHPLAGVPQHVLHRCTPGFAAQFGYGSIVIACSGQFSAPSAPAPRARRRPALRARCSARTRRRRTHRARARSNDRDRRRGRHRRAPSSCAERIRGSFAAYSLRSAPCADRDGRPWMSAIVDRGHRGACSRGQRTREPATDAPRPRPRRRRTGSIRRCGSTRYRCSGRTTATTARRTRRSSPSCARNNPAVVADGLDYGHRPLARAVRPRRPPDRARRVRRSRGRQVRASTALLETARHTRARPGHHAQARIQGDPRGVHRHALDVPHVRAVHPGGQDVVRRAPRTRADHDRSRDEGRRS